MDGDRRSAEEIASLGLARIMVLGVNEVENLYYSQAVIEAVASKQAEHLEKDANTLVQEATTAALRELHPEAVKEGHR